MSPLEGDFVWPLLLFRYIVRPSCISNSILISYGGRMSAFSLKPTHKPVKAYFQGLEDLDNQGIKNEGAVAPLFADLLRQCANKAGHTFATEQPYERLRFDGVVLSKTGFTLGVWEAKDTDDDLKTEVRKKFAKGYPKDNILFQSPDGAILYQDSKQLFQGPINDPAELVEVLELFFRYQPPAYENWEKAVVAFKDKVPEIGRALQVLITRERKINKDFITAFGKFLDLCREAINPNLSESAIEEMLIQHILTQRLFSKVFNNPDFAQRNIIAKEIETVIQALTSQTFSRREFLRPLDHFYIAIEQAAGSLHNWAEKQTFMNTVYEQFFQGFSVKVADTHGIVYTPQLIVEFMVRSVDEILKKEFGKTLGDKGVHILDPFVGTGNFILRVMREIPKSKLEHKYDNELHCNEVMLLPYYLSSMNIEHEFFEQTGYYKPFEGICLVDTFELAEDLQQQLAFMSKENTARVKKQKETPIFVILGNPPYNAHQVNENDNNKNRKYPVMDKRVAETYSKDSKATNKNALSDAYVKAFRWASDRIGDEGILTFVSNNGYFDGYAFGGMRKHLEQDFSSIYHIDLKGNARTSGEERRKQKGNVFDDTIRVRVGITFMIKKKQNTQPAKVYVYAVDDYMTSKQKKEYLDKSKSIASISWKLCHADENHTWLTEGLRTEWPGFIPIGSKDAKAGKGEAIFSTYGRGVATSRDAWAYNFNRDALVKNMESMINEYNRHVHDYQSRNPKPKIDSFVTYDDSKISWSRDLKQDLQRNHLAEFDKTKIRRSLYRPFIKRNLFFDRIMNEEVYQFPRIFPTPETEEENLTVCVSGVGSSKPPQVLIANTIPCLDMLEKTQCFPFYTYDEDGSNRRENITDWALDKFRKQYKKKSITKWDIFHYIYALLHHPFYRAHYEVNLKKELPRIPFAPDFQKFANAGKKLAELHVNYEKQPEYPLEHIENPDLPLDWRVEKMKLSKDMTRIIYNDFLTLAGIPAEAFEYKLGNRSALHWIIDQYQEKIDKRSGIENDPNRLDDPEYIVRLIKQVITVSLETVKIVNNLPELGIEGK